MKYSLGEISAICGGILSGAEQAGNVEVNSVFTDSRNIAARPGGLFVAIDGLNHDGHTYVNELYSRGVRAFIIEKDIATRKYPDAGFILVDSSVAALQKLAADYRSRFTGTVVAVTGSNGKTIVKEWIAALTPPGVKLFRSPKSYNSQIGVPLSVLMMSGNEDIAVIEAGISEKGEMERLERIIRPDIGVITNIGDAHQENFQCLDDKLSEKLFLFRNASGVVYNSGYEMVGRELAEKYPGVGLTDSLAYKEAGMPFNDAVSKENAATAVAVWDVLGYPPGETLTRIGRLHPVAMRLELKEGLQDSIIVNDSYNSDVNSLAIALDYLESVAGGRKKVLILSDILQSGFSEKELYMKIAGLAEGSKVEKMIGIGPKMIKYRSLFGSNASFYPTTDSFMRALDTLDVSCRAVLIKGNRESQFEKISHLLERKSHTTVMEIDLDAITHNYNVHRSLLKDGTKVMVMVKASGYGHGTYELARTLQGLGADYIAVAFADEGVQLRESGITMPIVVLNADAGSFDLMIANSLEPEIYNLTSLGEFASAVLRYGDADYPVHIKLDTGMRRLGFEPKDTGELVRLLNEYAGLLRVRSVFSHLAVSDDPSHDAFTAGQLEAFDAMSGLLCNELGYKSLRHIANSAAIERFPDAQYDMVRLGIGLYGISAVPDLGLRSASSLKTRIVQVKELVPGETVGYGRAGTVGRPSRIATIPVGYADGLDRHLGEGRWSVVIKGVCVPVIGRICMDTCMVDVTDVDAAEGDEVEIFGAVPGNTVEDMARRLGTIPYEIMTGISSRVKRIYIKE